MGSRRERNRPRQVTFDVRCVSETRIQDSTVVLQLSAFVVSRHFPRPSGHEAVYGVDRLCVRIVLIEKAEAAILTWIAVQNRWCCVRLAAFGRIVVFSATCLSFRHTPQRTVAVIHKSAIFTMNSSFLSAGAMALTSCGLKLEKLVHRKLV